MSAQRATVLRWSTKAGSLQGAIRMWGVAREPHLQALLDRVQTPRRSVTVQ